MALRSIVSIDASGGNLEATLASPADAILLTVSDARFPSDLLRTAAQLSASKARDAAKKAFVTINHPRTKLTRGDLEVLVGPDLAGVVLPHCVEPQDVRDVAVLLREFELRAGIEPGAVAVIPQIDTARGLIRAIEIVQAAPRVAGLIFHGKRYANDTGARDEEKGERLSYARGAVVAAARAFDKLPLVAASGLELRVMAQSGFCGAVLTDEALAVLANTTFATREGQVARAHEEIAAYEAARAGEEWVGRIGSDVIDAHTVRKARQRLD